MLGGDDDQRGFPQPLLLQLADELPQRLIDKVELLSKSLSRSPEHVGVAALESSHRISSQLLSHTHSLKVRAEHRRNAHLAGAIVGVAVDLIENRLYMNGVIATDIR